MMNEISCEDALRQIQEYLDGEVHGVSRGRIEAHFEVCGRCYPHLNLEKAYREAVRRAVAGEAAPAELRAKVVALIAEIEPES